MSDISETGRARRPTPRQPLKAKPRPDLELTVVVKEINERFRKTLAYLAD
jgi:hypothetical protein